MNCPYQYVLEMFDSSGSPLEQSLLSVDFEPAEEWARFMAVRTGKLGPADPGAAATIAPLWHPKLGEPYTEGFEVRIPSETSREVSSGFTTSYFARVAEEASSLLIERGRLTAGNRFQYLVAAYPREASDNDRKPSRFPVTRITSRFPIRPGRLVDFLDKSPVHLPKATTDIPVLLPRFVIDEANQLSHQAGVNETGGILIGHLFQDPQIQEVFLAITAQVFASQAKGDSTSLTFTADTWSEAQETINLRKQDEVMVGWWHRHPVKEWCKQCPPERRARCPLSSQFLSTHDRALHRAVFPRAYGVALVVNDISDEEPTHSMFGWRKGQLESRDFFILEKSFPKMPGVNTRPGADMPGTFAARSSLTRDKKGSKDATPHPTRP